MANTINQTFIIEDSRRVVKYITLVSDGSQETNTIVYDSSAVASDVGIADQLNCRIEKVWFTASKAASTATIDLDFDATTDVLALPINMSATGDSNLHMDYTFFGGLKNYAGAGRTGDILLTTTGLASGDAFTLVLDIRV